ncbi:MAG: hypothetical protein WAW61_09685 [Methylococcaceae bacterium]
MYYWGTGQRAFLGFGATLDCSHCNNRVVEQIYATYSYEQAVIFRWKHLGDRGSEEGDGVILFLCPTCMYGTQALGAEAAEREKKKIAKTQGGTAAAAFAIDIENQLKSVQARFDMRYTREWFNSLNLLAKHSHVKLLQRLGLYKIAEQLGS